MDKPENPHADKPLQDAISGLFDANARIAGMWPFPMWEPSEHYLEAFEYREKLPPEIAALCDGWDEEEREALLEGDCSSARDAHQELASAAHWANLYGFVGVVDVPVFRACGGGASFSWGHYSSELIFARSADALLVKAQEIGEADYAAALARGETTDGGEG